jgi:hypothetical protein
MREPGADDELPSPGWRGPGDGIVGPDERKVPVCTQ